MDDPRSTARRSGSDRRGSDRRGGVSKRLTMEAPGDGARAPERRTSLRRLKSRRSLLERRAAAPLRVANRG
jgi:hypothetical protein